MAKIDPALTLRRASADDAAKIALLSGGAFLTAFAHDHPGDALVAHVRDHHNEGCYAHWAEDPACALWIVETPLGAPVGYALMTPPALDIAVDPGDLELKRIYALSGWQGAGIGRALLEAVLEEARLRGAKNLYLCVYEANHRAQRFYAREGFTRAGTQRFMVSDVAFTDYILVRSL